MLSAIMLTSKIAQILPGFPFRTGLGLRQIRYAPIFHPLPMSNADWDAAVIPIAALIQEIFWLKLNATFTAERLILESPPMHNVPANAAFLNATMVSIMMGMVALI